MSTSSRYLHNLRSQRNNKMQRSRAHPSSSIQCAAISTFPGKTLRNFGKISFKGHTVSPRMIHLGGDSLGGSKEKRFSRLLYPNPVCFLCHREFGADSSVESSMKEDRLPQDNVMVVSWLMSTNNHGKFLMSLNKRRCTAQGLVDAVSSLSDARFGVSAAEASRGTQETMYPKNSARKARFTLCVPVAGMEELVLAVGSTSGRVASKFKTWIKQG